MSYAKDSGRIRDLCNRIADGSLTSEALVERCLARIAEADGKVQAWLHVQSAEAKTAARTLDAETKAGQRRGPLHGIPVAVKDVIDVKGLPTRANSKSRANVGPASADATVVAHLRAAGAIILGKVHTTEYAYYESIPPTRNPHDLTRTPGGSSAGSAAAVASGTVPLALGTQTAASVNRPAAYCGIGAFKPSTLSIGGAGIVPLAPSFDTCGALGATAQDAAYLAAGYAADHLGLSRPLPGTMPEIIVIRDEIIATKSAKASADRVAALTQSLTRAGLAVTERESPVSLEEIRLVHRQVMVAELGRAHGALPREFLAPRLAADIAEGVAISDADYHSALHQLMLFRRRFWPSFGPNAVLLLPATPDVAPADGTTGDGTFIIPTTALGGAVATVRAGFAAETNMPVGALLLVAPGQDARLAGFLMSETATALDL